ncbi:hydrogenase 3 maturation endopeptidase HyCI [Candidatus Bathyarchaeota archaeon]|nr:hydrogenase 3 maturation endopeptidase HyCI [Candidatus Bathyarchaeota archaeon]
MAGFEEHDVDIESSLKDWFIGAEKVVVAGIGNPFRRDDFVGVKIVRNLKRKVSDSVYLIEAETIPESFMQQIIRFKPTHILLVDAGIINKQPGTPQLAEPTQLIRKTSISTHTLPLRIFCDYLTETTAAKIGLLIIQPMDTSFGEGLTTKLKQTVKALTNLLQKLLP